MIRIIGLIFLLIVPAVFISCGGASAVGSDEVLQNPGDTPMDAYKRLFTAVKSKNTAAIKAEVSARTQTFAETLAERQKVSIDKVYENGFTASTFSEQLPEMRDQRIKEKMGALEVWNAKDSKWEDLPFIRETSGWKLAIGDVFSNAYTSPGKGLAIREKEAANAADPNHGIKTIEVPANANFTGGPRKETNLSTGHPQ